MTPLGDTVGCDIGGSSVKLLCLRDGSPSGYPNEFFSRAITLDTPQRNDRHFIDEVAGAILAIAEQQAGPPQAIGVAFCGLLDATRRQVVRSNNLSFLNGCQLAARLGQQLGLPVTLDADTNAGAMAEAAFGAGRGSKRLLYLSLGTGVGAALIVGGQPLRVSHHTVGQVAHLQLTTRAQNGAAETLRVEDALSTRGILAAARRHGVRVQSTLDLFYAAQARESSALTTWHEVGTLAGQLLATLVTLWSPDRVVIGGGTAGAGEFFLDGARRVFEETLPEGVSQPDIRTAATGRIAGALGAALLARRGHP